MMWPVGGDNNEFFSRADLPANQTTKAEITGFAFTIKRLLIVKGIEESIVIISYNKYNTKNKTHWKT